MFSVPVIIAGIIFGGVGFIAAAYGKKQENWRVFGVGIVLMAYPYFVTNVIANYAIGVVLCIALYIFRD